VSDPAQSQAAWDDALRGAGGHLLQSWRWGEFKARHGWGVERFAVAGGGQVAMAQVLFRQRGPYAIAYVPRGPALSGADPDLARALLAQVDHRCVARRVIHMIVELNGPLPFTGTFKGEGFVRGPDHIQPGRTVKVPLVEDEALLAQMQQKTRYSVRLAERRGVEYDRIEGEQRPYVDRFYALLHDTAARNEFGIHDRAYYDDFLRLFGDDALLLFARYDGNDAAGLIAAAFGEEAIYMYAATSTTHRAHGAAFGIQFEAMRWARERGCARYDLWGIPDSDPERGSDEDGKAAATRGDDWRGLYRFKTGFGGEIVSYPPTLERRYRPALSFLARRLYGRTAA
jgi:lipid II:glycine glycyltransferase (peptidoglycan interpeptide bridge formation enzyme)